MSSLPVDYPHPHQNQLILPEWHIPKRVTIETIHGCNAKCVMCPLSLPAKRKKGKMPMALFTKIVKDLEPYGNKLQMMDLFGLGEPLLDPLIFDRIRLLKEIGFSNVGFSTNADLLSKDIARQIIESGLDNLIISIDGATKSTHEVIRKNTTFENVRDNSLYLLELRQRLGSGPRVIIRFIRQDSNRDEFVEFKAFWQRHLDRGRNDLIAVYDAHTHGGEMPNKSNQIRGSRLREQVEKISCNQIFEILYILNDGTVPLCSEDWYRARFNAGNARDTNVIDLFNSTTRIRIRDTHKQGNKSKIKKCRECTVHYSSLTKETYS
jgi:radical SAM protein with 4Fe4S-binding SPASM domain